MARGPAWFRQKAGRRDPNHASIRDALRKLGHFVVDLGGAAGGVPDLLVFPKLTSHMAFADIFVFGATREPPPVFIELKAAKGKLRASQLEWRAKAEARGVRVAVARDLTEALEALR